MRPLNCGKNIMSNQYYGKTIKGVDDIEEYKVQYALGTITNFDLVAVYDSSTDSYDIHRHKAGELFYINSMTRSSFKLRYCEFDV